MEQRVKQNLITLGVKPGDSIAAAVSGGADSMALLHCLNNLSADMRIRVSAYHMEHGIRGESSLRDMEFVKSRCAKMGIVCVVKRVNVPAVADDTGLTTEAAARNVRYGFLDSADADFVATAHHIDDNAETVIMNLLRGSGLKGLCGIPARRGRYIRPMLGIPKADIDEYIKLSQIEHITDETNEDTAYTRNFVRKEVMPLLRRINGAAAENIARTAALLAEDEEALTEAALESGCIERTEEGAYIDLVIFKGLKTAVKKRAVRLAVSAQSGLEDLENVHMQSILELAAKARAGKRINLARGLFAAVVYNKLMIGKTSDKKYNIESVALKNGRLSFAGYEFYCGRCEGVPEYGQDAEYFDERSVEGAVFRHRREGDVISPLGMSGTKRLSDYLSDRKVPLHMRDSLVLLAKENEALWVVGVGVSESSGVKKGNIIKISYRGSGECMTT